VCVPTRNRGARIAPLLESLRRLDHDSFEVIVVDQSTDNLCRQTCEETVGDDPRVSYLPSGSSGSSIARNLGLAHARGALVAFTDDDCVAPRDWLTGIERAFSLNPGVAAICGGVRAADHDPTQGCIPVAHQTPGCLHRSPWLAYRELGIGANLAFRSQTLREVGGFDELLGVGAPLRSAADNDVIYRLLRSGHDVLDLPEPAIIHDGFRSWGEGMRRLWRNYALGAGAYCSKHLRCGDPAILPSFLVLWFGRLHPWNILRLRRPMGVGTFLAFARGFTMGFRYPVNRRLRTYMTDRRRWPAYTPPSGASSPNGRPTTGKPSDARAATDRAGAS
jgi:glycosyltransferase involved in cell wall biosynthesis